MPTAKVVLCGEKLGVELPDAIAERLALKPGDQVSITVEKERPLELRDEETRVQAITRLRAMRRPFPPDFKFDREEANAR